MVPINPYLNSKIILFANLYFDKQRVKPQAKAKNMTSYSQKLQNNTVEPSGHQSVSHPSLPLTHSPMSSPPPHLHISTNTYLTNQASVSERDYTNSNGGTNDQRYKKALKQISKLVSISSSVKKQLQAERFGKRRLEEQYQMAIRKWKDSQNRAEGLAKENQQLRAELTKTRQQIQRLHRQESGSLIQMKNRQSKFSQQNFGVFESKVNNQNIKLQNIHIGPNKQQFEQQITYLKNQISQYQLKILQKDDVINELQLTLQEKYLELLSVEGRYGDLNEQFIKVQMQLKEGQDRIGEFEGKFQQKIAQRLEKQRIKIAQLQEKLKKSQQWSKYIQLEYEQVKKSIIMSQQPIGIPISMSKDMTNSLSIKMGPLSTVSGFSGMQNPGVMMSLTAGNAGRMKTQTDFNRRNYRFKSKSKQKQGGNVYENEQQISKIKKEYKLKYKQQIARQSEQIEELSKKIIKLNIFIQKQQFYIQNYINNSGFQTPKQVNKKLPSPVIPRQIKSSQIQAQNGLKVAANSSNGGIQWVGQASFNPNAQKNIVDNQENERLLQEVHN